METDKNKHLECVLKSIKVSNEQGLLNKHFAERWNKRSVRAKIWEKYIFSI